MGGGGNGGGEDGVANTVEVFCDTSVERERENMYTPKPNTFESFEADVHS